MYEAKHFIGGEWIHGMASGESVDRIASARRGPIPLTVNNSSKIWRSSALSKPYNASRSSRTTR